LPLSLQVVLDARKKRLADAKLGQAFDPAELRFAADRCTISSGAAVKMRTFLNFRHGICERPLG
jgi:hypothetical protein